MPRRKPAERVADIIENRLAEVSEIEQARMRRAAAELIASRARVFRASTPAKPRKPVRKAQSPRRARGI